MRSTGPARAAGPHANCPVAGRAKSSGVERLVSVQILRAIAALSVVLCHAAGLPLGAAGVDLFFVISGFIITKVMTGREPGEFFRDRAFRIFPTYYIHLVPWFLIAAAAGLLTAERSAVSLTLWPAYGEIARPYLKLAWTLSFEMLFYAAMAVVLLTRRPIVPLLAYAAAMAAAFAIGGPLFSFVGNPLILEFLFGVAIAHLPRRSPGLGLSFAAIGLIALLPSNADILWDVGAVFDVNASPWRVLCWGVPCALIFYGILQLEPYFQSAVSRIPAYVGDASYTLYLSHLLVLILLEGIPWPVAALAAVLIAVGLYELTEKRLQSWYRRRKKRAAEQPLSTSPPIRHG